MPLKSLSYNMSIVGTASKPGVWITPAKHNVEANKETGKKRFYMNERGLERFRKFVLEQWQSNLNSE